VCVERDGQVGIEPDERHLEHGCDHNPPAPLPATVACGDVPGTR
jgi:hypothetical protein